MEDRQGGGETLEELDVEQFAQGHPADCRKPHARRYYIRINRERFTVEKECMTTEELLRLVGLDTARARLFQVFRGGRDEELVPGQTTCFTAPGVDGGRGRSASRPESRRARPSSLAPPSSITTAPVSMSASSA